MGWTHQINPPFAPELWASSPAVTVVRMSFIAPSSSSSSTSSSKQEPNSRYVSPQIRTKTWLGVLQRVGCSLAMLSLHLKKPLHVRVPTQLTAKPATPAVSGVIKESIARVPGAKVGELVLYSNCTVLFTK